MAARVAAARGLPVAAALTGLLTDDTPRVRAAAARALGVLGDDADAIRPLLKDKEIDVRRAAQQGIDGIRARFPAP
jgi:HEAT repeat protein